ncbi:MAG: VOC family protein [Bacteroidales bacterium]|nr:VOC family protein [Bacteroidales bacterium]
MTTINPYLTFNGNCEEAFNFYKSVFGGEFPYIGRFKDMPAGSPVPDDMKEKIMHVSLPISKETTLMGSDASETFGQTANFGDNISLSVNTDSEEEATSLFAALSEGGRITMPLEKTFWNALFGMCTDQFGINWMVNYDFAQNH